MLEDDNGERLLREEKGKMMEVGRSISENQNRAWWVKKLTRGPMELADLKGLQSLSYKRNLC